jgi:UDP-N-acetylglucosamine acyltransferase
MELEQKIHPTALIHPKSKIHSTVKIGAYSVIGKNVQIDQGSEIGNFVTLTGNTTIGKDNKIYHYCSLGEAPQDKKFKNEKTYLSIGDRNTIREFCTFNVGTVDGGGLTQVGNDSSLAGHVEIDDFAILGGFTLVHQFCKIGAHIITAVGTIILKDIPPYIRAAGDNAKPNGINIEGLKRRNFSTQSILDIKKAYKVIYREGNTIETAKKMLLDLGKKTNEVNLFIDFINKSNRGLIR